MNKSIIIIAAAVIAIAVIAGAVIYLTQGRAKPAYAVAEMLDLGEKYLFDLNYEEAILQFTKIIEIEPMNVRAYLGGADAYLHLGRQQEAVDLLKAGVEATGNANLAHALEGVEKSITEGYIAIAEAYDAEGWHDKAMETLQRIYNETGDEIIGRKLGIVEATTIKFRDDYVIQWKDAEFERLIREYLGKPGGDIHYDDVKLIKKIEIWGEIIEKDGENLAASYWSDGFQLRDGREGSKTGKIRSLADLEHFTSLKELTVNYQENLSISALEDTETIDWLKRLENLELVADNISDISPISGLIALEWLELGYNNITDISPISMLIELEYVSLNNNEQLASAEALRGLRKLSSVSISQINTVDLNVFAGMPELKSMHLVNVENIDYSILTRLQLEYLETSCDDEIFQIIRQLKSLNSLRLHAYGLTDITGIEALTNLTKLDLLAPNCRDISAIASLNLEILELELPNDCDLTPLTKISTLQKVIVPDYRRDPSEQGTPLIDRVKALLPNVEVSSDR
ncbi:MAG TPA: leucine-rich repeat domain-containing protein [Clostridia bacterium]